MKTILMNTILAAALLVPGLASARTTQHAAAAVDCGGTSCCAGATSCANCRTSGCAACCGTGCGSCG